MVFANMRPQMARLPKRSVALLALVVFALLVHSAHMPPQNARCPKRSVALLALVVFALLMHRAHMHHQTARRRELAVALRAHVVFVSLGGGAATARSPPDGPRGTIASCITRCSRCIILAHHARMLPKRNICGPLAGTVAVRGAGLRHEQEATRPRRQVQIRILDLIELD
jgi:hypothetical protein